MHHISRAHWTGWLPCAWRRRPGPGGHAWRRPQSAAPQLDPMPVPGCCGRRAAHIVAAQTASNGRGSLSGCAVSSTLSGGQGIRFSLMTGFYGGCASGAAAVAYLENDADHKAKPRTGVDVLRCAPGTVGAGLVSAVVRPYTTLRVTPINRLQRLYGGRMVPEQADMDGCSRIGGSQLFCRLPG